MAIEQIFTWFMTSGAYDALLPFFLIFTLVFAFLQKSNLFGDDAAKNKKFNIILALIIGLMVVVPHVTDSYPSGSNPIKIVQDAIPNVMLWIIAIFSLWLLMAALGLPVTFGESTAGFQGFLTILSIAIVAIIFGYAAGWFPPNWDLTRWLDSIDAGVLQIIFIIAIVLGVLVWLLSDDTPSTTPKRSAADSVGDMFAQLGKSLGNKKNK